MPPGDILHIHQIETGIDVARHPAIEKINNELASRCRLKITNPYRSARVDNHNRHAFSDGTQDGLLSKELAPFIMANHVRECDGSFFVAGGTIPRQAEGRD